MDGKDGVTGHHWQVWGTEHKTFKGPQDLEKATDVKKMSPPSGYHYCAVPSCEVCFRCPYDCKCLDDSTFWLNKHEPKHKKECKCKCRLKKDGEGWIFICEKEKN